MSKPPAFNRAQMPSRSETIAHLRMALAKGEELRAGMLASNQSAEQIAQHDERMDQLAKALASREAPQLVAAPT